MLIISVGYNENKRWKRNAKTNKQTKTEMNKGEGAEAIMKGWELSDFVVQ